MKGFHHLEIWLPAHEVGGEDWSWLLGRLGFVLERDWGTGRSWSAGGVYLTLTSSPNLADASHDRRRAGLNHLAFHGGTASEVDAVMAEAPEHGWIPLYQDRYPHAGGPQHYAGWLENAAGFKAEVVAEETAGSEPPVERPAWRVRPETPADREAVRAVELAAFPTAEEADLVDALRADPGAWIDGLSYVAEDEAGDVVGHALLTRCLVGDRPALALAPCAVLPDRQRTGAGGAAIRGALEAARARGENLVVVLGHAEYYPRFGFVPASGWGIAPPFEVPDEAFMALRLDPSAEAPRGTVGYPAAFGV